MCSKRCTARCRFARDEILRRKICARENFCTTRPCAIIITPPKMRFARVLALAATSAAVAHGAFTRYFIDVRATRGRGCPPVCAHAVCLTRRSPFSRAGGDDGQVPSVRARRHAGGLLLPAGQWRGCQQLGILLRSTFERGRQRRSPFGLRVRPYFAPLLPRRAFPSLLPPACRAAAGATALRTAMAARRRRWAAAPTFRRR